MLCVWHTIDVMAPPTEVGAFDEEERNGSSDDHADKDRESNNFENEINCQAVATKVYARKKHQRGKQTKQKASNVYKVSNVG